MTGFEPATPSSRTKYATGLRYIPPSGRQDKSFNEIETFLQVIRIWRDTEAARQTETIISIDFLKTENVQTSGVIEIEKDQSKRNYLQLTEGSFGTALKAGLFKK
jgi:hypothetical protein